VYEELRGNELRGFALALLHGRMDDEEKRRVMGAFQSGKTRVLVTTTVIEVGIDVPNATVMVVESAERFGLSQLHQLRGRIARGSYTGFCFLLPATENRESLDRLELVADTRDGFEIAEADFKLRGPGELLGTRQHGLPPLRAGDLLADRKLLQEARRHAGELLKADPGLRAAEQQPLRAAVLARFGRSLDLADVG
jgi:ATP-dependent DNA helicase RecG